MLLWKKKYKLEKEKNQNKTKQELIAVFYFPHCGIIFSIPKMI